MAHRDTGFRPNLGVEGYRGLELWEYDIGPQQKNDGVVDGDIDLEELLGGIDEIKYD
jgi:hypothetical protein